MVHSQIQVGSYRLEIAVLVASVGGDAGSDNEGTRRLFLFKILNSLLDTVRSRTVTGNMNITSAVEFEENAGNVYREPL